MSVQYLFLVIFALQTFKIMSLRIKEVLKEKGISVIQLSEKLGVTRSACYQYINGNPTAECLERIALALDVEIGELFDIKKDKKES